MLIYHKKNETTVDMLEVILGFEKDNIKLFKDLEISTRQHCDLLKEISVGQVLVTGVNAVNFDYNGTVCDYDIFDRYLKAI